MNNIKYEFYYITILGIVQYNDREEYFGYLTEFKEDSVSVFLIIFICILLVAIIAAAVIYIHRYLKKRKGTAVEREISKFSRFTDEEEVSQINENRVY